MNTPINQQTIESFHKKYTKAKNGCWNWTASVRNKYGKFGILGITESAHRFSYRLFKGEIADDMTIDHKCENKLCVNPKHLRQLTCRDNLLRSNTLAGINARKLVCQNGHPFDKITSAGSRSCSICKLAGKRGRRRKKRQIQKNLLSL